MLINFRVSNFLSFREEVEFSALAGLERQHRDRIFQSKPLGLNLLPTAAFYGGNGAGKSNLYKALQFARKLVLQAGVKPEDSIERECFRLDPKCRNEPSCFGFDLLIGKHCLRYEFAVTEAFVVAESLGFLVGDTVKPIFQRILKNGQNSWSPDAFKALKLDKKRIEFLHFKTQDLLENELFIAALRGRRIPILEDVGDWFKNRLVLLDPRCDFRPVEVGLMQVEAFKAYCIESLDKAGTGIEQLENQSMPFEVAPIPQEMKEHVAKTLQTGDKHQMIMIRNPIDRSRFIFLREEGEIKALKLTTSHKDRDGGSVSFELAEESEGTERLIDLLPAFFELSDPSSDKVFFIDELDRSLHTHLTRGLVESFLDSRTTESRAQMLFTTHDPLLLDQDLLRRDEIWFIDKHEDGHSELTSLSDFEGVRADKDIRKNYLIGRFAGVPRVRRLPRQAQQKLPVPVA
ncbi:MAG: ATP-binding protein [Puniceicoccaceae bacterium]|nr:MAG: ATP-binding protein [Puniceicoccaceae bacterium]